MRTFAFIFFLVLSGCSIKLSPTSYLDYVRANEKDYTVSVNGSASYQLSYVTIEQIIAENISDNNLKESRQEFKKAKENPISAFNLKIKVESGNLFSQSQVQRSVQMEYYSVEFKKQVLAVTNSLDTISCEGYLFEAGAGFGPYSNFEFYFPSAIEELKEIIIYPKYFESQPLNFDLSNLHHKYPALRIE